ncbi:hypothetical protein D3C72_2341270 [compost metagenome]
MHPPTGLPGKTVNHRQAKPGTLTDGFGREKRFEGALDHFLRHTGARVDNFQQQVIALQQILVVHS